MFVFLFLCFWPHCTACGILIIWSEIEHMPPALEGKVLTTGLLETSPGPSVFNPFCVYCKKSIYFFSLHVNIQSSQYPSTPVPFVEDIILFPLCILGTLVESQLIVYVWIYFWAFFFSVLLVSVNMPVSRCLKLNIQKTKMGIQFHCFMANRWRNSGNSGWLYFFGLQNQCRWWLQPWN